MKDKIQIMEMLIEAYKHDGESIEKLKPISEKLHVMWKDCFEYMRQIDALTTEIQNITINEGNKILTPLKSI